MILKSSDEFLGFLEKGHLSRDLMAAIQEVTKNLADAGEGKGAVTLKINFDAKGPILSISNDIAITLPKKKRRASAAFLNDQGEISLQHPDQAPLPLGGTGERIDRSAMRRTAQDIG